MRQRLDESVLHSVQGVRFVVQETKRHPVGHHAIASEQFLKRVFAPTGRVGQQLFVAEKQKASSYSHWFAKLPGMDEGTDWFILVEGCATNATCRPAHKFIASLHHFTHPSRAALHALHCIACIALQSMQGFATQFENV